MFNWFQHKKYPQFWNDYLSHFKRKKEHEFNKIRFVVFDTETTGLNTSTDKILSIGAIAIIGNVINVADSFECYLIQKEFNAKTVEIHGILKEGSISKIEEKEAIIQFLAYVKDAVIVAHHAAFDIKMINNALKKLDLPKLKNKVLDTGILYKKIKKSDKHYSLDDLCEVFTVSMHDRHTASGDAYITGLIFLKILSQLNKIKTIQLKDLFFNSDRKGLI